MKSIKILVSVIALTLCSGALLAAETVVDTTQFKVRTQAGAVEVVSVENLAVGETRTVNSTAGTPVVVGRHEQGYVLDINGERIEVDAPQIEHPGHGDPLVIAGGAGKRIVIHTDHHKSEKGDAAQQQRKLVVVKRGKGEGADNLVVSDTEAHVLLDELNLGDTELPEGKRVMVVRKIEKHVEPGTQ